MSPVGPWRRGARTRVGRYTERAHARAGFFDGIVQGVLTLNEYVAKKTLSGSDAVITALVMSQSISLFFSSYWSGFIVAREKRSTFLLFGVLGRLSLLFVLAATTGPTFAAVVIFATFMAGPIIPAQNALFQANYSADERGRAYGRVTAVQSVAIIATALLAGWLYDRWASAYRWVYAVAGVAGFASCWIYYRIRFRRRRSHAAPLRPLRHGLGGDMWRSLRSPFAGSFKILRNDREFRRYETAYMAYGVAFMMLQPVIPIFLVETLHIEYSQASYARGLIFYAMVVVFSPVFGGLHDASDPVRISRSAFLLLSLFPVGMILARSVTAIYVCFAIYGAAMAAVNIGWTMGPIHFAGDRDSAAYMGAHVALVGVRGLIGGPIGILLYRLAGTAHATFAAATALFLLGAWLMHALARSEPVGVLQFPPDSAPSAPRPSSHRALESERKTRL